MKNIKIRKSIIRFLLIIGLGVLLTGCFDGASEKEEDYSGGDIGEESPSDIFASEESEQSLGAFSFGPLSDHDEREVYEYTGEDIRIPFQVAGMDTKGSADFGLLVFLDGISQPYRIEESNGTSSEEQVMHKFYLEGEASKQFEIVFTPVIGEEGEKVSIVFSTIFQPDYTPQNEEITNYGVYHDLNATLPQEVYFKVEPPNSSQRSIHSASVSQEIPEEIKSQNNLFQTNGSSDIFDEITVVDLLPVEESSEKITAKNGKAKMKFRLYGGPEVTYRTTIFVNHIPVQVLGAELLETTTEKGKMNTIEFELDTNAYGEINTIYAISVVSDKGYLTDAASPLKTKSVLLLNHES